MDKKESDAPECLCGTHKAKLCDGACCCEKERPPDFTACSPEFTDGCKEDNDKNKEEHGE